MTTFEKFKERRAAGLKARKNRAEKRKELILKKGQPLFKKYGIRKVIVFGSVAKGLCSESSDLDIIVMPLDNKKYWDFRFELEETLGLPIDLYTENDNPEIIHKAISNGEILYEV